MGFNEYGATHNTTKALLATALKNRILALDPTLTVALKNIRVNGNPQGCSGFVTDPATGKIVYVNTDHNHGTQFDNAYCRTAAHTKDYRGGRNHTSTYSELPEAVVTLVHSPEAHVQV